MVLGAHNSWSYLRPRKWWMRLIGFTAKCQRYNIKDQYNRFGVRCFDLRIRFNKDELPVICHGVVEYKYTYGELLEDLYWLNAKEDAIVRILLELRGVPKNKWGMQKRMFKTFYSTVLKPFYSKLTFIRGRSLPDWEKVIRNIQDMEETESYASVSYPRYIDDWIPIVYAKWHNRIARATHKESNILLLDFVDI